MTIDRLVEMADNQRDCNFHEVQMYALVEIAKSLRNIENTMNKLTNVSETISLTIQE
jgi:hypothetical protein